MSVAASDSKQPGGGFSCRGMNQTGLSRDYREDPFSHSRNNSGLELKMQVSATETLCICFDDIFHGVCEVVLLMENLAEP